MFAWSRNFYCRCNGVDYMFAAKMDRDYFVAHHPHAESIKAVDADSLNCVRVCASQELGANQYRQKEVRRWKNGF